MKVARVLVATFVVADLALTECSIHVSSKANAPAGRSSASSSPSGDPVTRAPATPETSADATGTASVHHISAAVRRRYLATGYRATDQRWRPRTRTRGTTHVTITQRRVPACDTGPWPHLAVDRDTLDFAASMMHRHGFVIARQLTVYPDARIAARFPRQMTHLAFCRYDGRTPYAVEGGHFSSGRAYGITDKNDGTLYSWGAITTDGKSAVWIDVVARKDNAVSFTRVMNPDTITDDPDPLMHTAGHAALRREARRQAAVSADLLQDLG
jgi:hypothetical protein